MLRKEIQTAQMTSSRLGEPQEAICESRPRYEDRHRDVHRPFFFLSEWTPIPAVLVIMMNRTPASSNAA
jgi:hypothetical protein